MSPARCPLRREEAQLLDIYLPMLESRFPADVRTATFALAAIGAAAVPSLCARLLDAQGRPHLHFLAVLNRIGVETVAEALPQLGVVEKASALHYLGSMGRHQVTHAVIHELRHEDPGVRAIAALTLGRTQDRRAIPALEQSARDPVAEVRARAIEALGRLGSSASLTLLMSALLDGHVEVRRAAAPALAGLKDPAAGDALIAALLDEDVVVRAEAAEGVGRLERTDATPLLLAILSRDHSRAREAAIVALGRCGDASAIGPLCALLNSSDEDVQLLVCRALAALAPRHPDPHLRAALPDLGRLASRWPNAPVRVRSTAAMTRDVILSVTAHTRQLPVPSGETPGDSANLPIPGAAQASS